MDGNEQVSFRPRRHLRALVQRNEDILISRHKDTIAAGRFELLRQHLAKLERDVFFRRIRDPSMRARIDPAMARIDDDEWPLVLRDFLRWRRSGSRPPFESAAGFLRRRETPCARISPSSMTSRAGSSFSGGRSSDFSISAGSTRSITMRDFPAASSPERDDKIEALAFIAGNLDVRFGQIHNDSIGIGDGEYPVLDLFRKKGDEPCPLNVAADLRAQENLISVRCRTPLAKAIRKRRTLTTPW